MSAVSILYVDDEINNLLLFKANFRRKYNVFLAQSGPEGLKELASHHDISVVISDMRMPVMSGIEFIRRARVKYPHMTYFILTGFEYNYEIDKALKDSTIQRYFTKPFDVNEIECAIDGVTKSK